MQPASKAPDRRPLAQHSQGHGGIGQAPAGHTNNGNGWLQEGRVFMLGVGVDASDSQQGAVHTTPPQCHPCTTGQPAACISNRPFLIKILPALTAVLTKFFLIVQLLNGTKRAMHPTAAMQACSLQPAQPPLYTTHARTRSAQHTWIHEGPPHLCFGDLRLSIGQPLQHLLLCLCAPVAQPPLKLIV